MKYYLTMHLSETEKFIIQHYDFLSDAKVALKFQQKYGCREYPHTVEQEIVIQDWFHKEMIVPYGRTAHAYRELCALFGCIPVKRWIFKVLTNDHLTFWARGRGNDVQTVMTEICRTVVDHYPEGESIYVEFLMKVWTYERAGDTHLPRAFNTLTGEITEWT